MKIVLIPDKFKGSVSSKEVVDALSRGLKRAIPEAELHSVLASDGGDGFLDAISNYLNIDEVCVPTFNPLGRQINAFYLWDKKNSIAYIEMAKASGMELLKAPELDPMRTSTYGTGVLIKDAILKGVNKIYVGLGGSATNDGGVGIASALGYSFFNSEGEELKPIGENLLQIHKLEIRNKELLNGVSFFAVNDVQNALYGVAGAAHIYAAQKGASSKEVQLLDEGLRNLDKIVKEQIHKNVAYVRGAGAAGGAAYGLKAFLNAEFVVGVDFLLGLTKIPSMLEREKFDYIITGEGKIDRQTLRGKLIKGVVQMGKKHKIPVLAVCGKLDIDYQELKELGVAHVLEIGDKTKSLEYNMKSSSSLIEKAVFEYFS